MHLVQMADTILRSGLGLAGRIGTIQYSRKDGRLYIIEDSGNWRKPTIELLAIKEVAEELGQRRLWPTYLAVMGCKRV